MKVVDFKTYMNESKKEDNLIDLYLSRRFIDLLMNMKDNVILKSFLSILIDDETGLCGGKFDVSFIDVSEKDDYISYITSNKANPVLDKYESMDKIKDGLDWCWVNNRQEQKLSRFITRIFGKKFELKDIEEFVSDYKVSFNKNVSSVNFEIIKGEDVLKYYNGKIYSDESNGQLQRSCMKYSESQRFFGLYKDNPEKMNMLILKDPNGKIYGRANIWHLDIPEGKTYMDRIYTTYDWQVKLFIDYALKNKWIYKSKQIYGGSVIPLIVNGKSEKIIISVNLKPKKYQYYPYVDTMQFYNPTSGVLTSDVENFKDDDYLTLVLANGQTYTPNDDTYKIDYLGRIVHGHFLRWSKHDDVYVHTNDAVLLRYLNDYVTPEHEFIKIKDDIYLKEDVEKNSETGEYIFNKKN